MQRYPKISGQAVVMPSLWGYGDVTVELKRQPIISIPVNGVAHDLLNMAACRIVQMSYHRNEEDTADRGLSARLQYLQCVSLGVTEVLH